MFGYVLLICCCSIDFSSRKSTYTGLGLTLNMLQIMGLFNDFWFTWPEIAKPFFAGAALFTFNLDLFAPECAMRGFYPEGLYERATLWLFLPIIFFVGYAGIYGIMFILRWLFFFNNWKVSAVAQAYSGFARILVMEPPMLRATFASGFVRLAIAGYPVLVARALSLLKCVQLTDGTHVLEQHYGMLCYDTEWYQYLWVAIIGLGLYAFGIPASIWWMLNAAREQHFSIMLKAKRESRRRHVELVHRTVSEHKRRSSVAPSVHTAFSATSGAGNTPMLQDRSKSVELSYLPSTPVLGPKSPPGFA